ncbi:MAG: hypothetical protein WCF84_02325 [Anaerolineae bacterium]
MVIYIGNGRFINGVPARDLEVHEWEALGAELRQTAIALDLYRETPVQLARGWDAGKGEPLPDPVAQTGPESESRDDRHDNL